MRHVSRLIIFCILLTAQAAIGQTICDFPIDSAKILANQNLDTFLNALKKDSFKITNNKKDLPDFIKKQLDCYASGFSLANPDQNYQSTDVVITEGLPRRKLTFLAKSPNVLIILYNIGGMGVSSHLVLIKFNGEKITDLWKGICRTEVKDINDIIKYLKIYQDKNLRRNDDYIYF